MAHIASVLFDSTVILGAILADAPQRDDCEAALALAARGRVRGHLCGSALGALHDELVRANGPALARRQIGVLRGYLGIVPTTDSIVDAALACEALYLDDAITVQSARGAGLDLIVTLNSSDFRVPGGRVRARLPSELIASLDGASPAETDG